MPAATVFSASMSRPESVSSRIASAGLRMASCRISSRFFSPPEKPSLTYRFMNASGIPIAFRCVFTVWRNSLTGTSAPRTPRSAARRKLVIVTPGIAVGYWKARKTPRFARSSGESAARSSPRYRTVPCVITYFGCPMRQKERVLLPEPLGPMRAWTSPALTVRLTPFTISFPSTATWRPSITKSGGSIADPFVIFSPCALGGGAFGDSLSDGVFAFQEAREGRLVQDALNVARQPGPDRADPAVGKGDAGRRVARELVTDVVGRLHRPERADDFPQRNRARRTVQHVTPLGPPHAVHEARAGQEPQQL